MADEKDETRDERFIGKPEDFTFYNDGSAPPVSDELKVDLAKWAKEIQAASE